MPAAGTTLSSGVGLDQAVINRRKRFYENLSSLCSDSDSDSGSGSGSDSDSDSDSDMSSFESYDPGSMSTLSDSFFIGKVRAREYFVCNRFRLLWNRSRYRGRAARFLESYELLGKAGQGSFGHVYYARGRDCGRPYVVKFFQQSNLMERPTQSLSLDNPRVRLVPTEVNALIELVRVRGACQLRDVFASPLGKYIAVMDAVPGALTLSDHLAEVDLLDEPEACRCFAQIVETLLDMQNRGRHHMDLKGSNVLVQPKTGATTLIDFGGSQRVSNEGFRKWTGTRANFPPEFRSEEVLYGRPLDVWCLGLLLVKMTAGRRSRIAFDSTTGVAVDVPDHLSPELRELIGQCLSEDPWKRPDFQTILESRWVTRREREERGLYDDPR